jgi:hypothetical protein
LYNDGTKYSKGRSYTSCMMEKATEDKTDLWLAMVSSFDSVVCLVSVLNLTLSFIKQSIHGLGFIEWKERYLSENTISKRWWHQ